MIGVRVKVKVCQWVSIEPNSGTLWASSGRTLLTLVILCKRVLWRIAYPPPPSCSCKLLPRKFSIMPINLNSTAKLNTGAEMPILGLGMRISTIRIKQDRNCLIDTFDSRRSGTWKSQPGAVEKAVEYALKLGYKSIDTAVRHLDYCREIDLSFNLFLTQTAYENEKEVGIGIKNSGVPRESIFLTTKVFDQSIKSRS